MKRVVIHLHPDFSEELQSVFQQWNNAQDIVSFQGVRLKREHEIKLLTGGEIPLNNTHKIGDEIRKEAKYAPSDKMMIFTEKRIYTDRYYQLFFGGTSEFAEIPLVTTISLDFMRKLFRQSSGINPSMFRAILVNILSSLAQGEGFSTHTETKGCILDFCYNMPDIIKGIESGPKFCDQHMKQIVKSDKNYLISLARVVSNTNDIVEQDANVSKRILSLKKTRLQEDESKFDYDVALSFAGEDRKYAEELAQVLLDNDIKVFCDGFEKAELWGENLYDHLSTLYKLRAKYCIMFLSEHYANKLWTNHERKAAQSRAFKDNKAYILPIRLDKTEIPGVLETVGYVNWSQEGAKGIASLVLQKLGRW
ncbi:TIR domain-containing protein [bacterium]|nr:TIR domain-containing protein [bacterium]